MDCQCGPGLTVTALITVVNANASLIKIQLLFGWKHMKRCVKRWICNLLAVRQPC